MTVHMRVSAEDARSITDAVLVFIEGPDQAQARALIRWPASKAAPAGQEAESFDVKDAMARAGARAEAMGFRRVAVVVLSDALLWQNEWGMLT